MFGHTYHLFSEEVKSLKGAERLGASMEVPEDDVGLATHFLSFQSHHV